MRGLTALTVLGLGLAAPTASFAAPASYNVQGGELVVKVLYDRGALIAGHDHLLSSTAFPLDMRTLTFAVAWGAMMCLGWQILF